MFCFLYWAHNEVGERKNFMDSNFYDIGSVITYNGEKVTIDDYATEFYSE